MPFGRHVGGWHRQPHAGGGATHLPAFHQRLDELHTLRRKASPARHRHRGPRFPDGPNPATTSGTSAQDLRWSRFRDLAPESLFNLVATRFSFIKNLGGPESLYASHMKEALFIMPTPACSPTSSTGSTSSPCTTATSRATPTSTCWARSHPPGRTGSSGTPRHIIDLMVKMTSFHPRRCHLRPRRGTCGFLVAAGNTCARTTRPKSLPTKPPAALFRGYFSWL